MSDFATCLLNEEHAGCHVPRMDADLPVAVEPATGDVGQIERGRAQATHGDALFEKVGELVDTALGVGVDIVGEAGGHESLEGVASFGDVDGSVV